MLKALDRDPHAARLGDLLQYFRTQESSITGVLHELQAELEHWHHAADTLRTRPPEDGGRALQRCTDLQAECDLLATELVHVRLAIAGAGEELADHQGRVLHTGNAARSRLAWA